MKLAFSRKAFKSTNRTCLPRDRWIESEPQVTQNTCLFGKSLYYFLVLLAWFNSYCNHHDTIKMNLPFVASMGQRENLSPRRESNSWPPRYRLGALTTELRETLGELGHFTFLTCYVLQDLEVNKHCFLPYQVGAIVCAHFSSEIQVLYVCFIAKCLFVSLFFSITEEMSAIQELRLLISSELERMKDLLSERRKMLLAGAARNPVCSGVTQKVTLVCDYLNENWSVDENLVCDQFELKLLSSAFMRYCLLCCTTWF